MLGGGIGRKLHREQLFTVKYERGYFKRTFSPNCFNAPICFYSKLIHSAGIAENFKSN